MLRIHADRADLPAGVPYVHLLYPFWGVPPEDPRDVTRGRFDRYVAEAPSLFELAPLEQADVVLYPAPWECVAHDPEQVARARRSADHARTAGKPFAVFYVSDAAEPVPVDGATVFRTSMYRSKRRAGEYALPAWTEDFVERYFGGEHDVRPWRETPAVGFMGYDTAIPPLHKLVAKRLLGRPAISTRGRARRAFGGSRLVDADLVVNDRFFGGALRNGDMDWERQRAVRTAYVDNIRGSDYVIAVRGAETWGPTGNFSYRLYEVLSAGRIPIVVDTDIVMPLDDLLDWKSFTVWLDRRDLRRGDVHVRRFHDRLDGDSFAEVQRAARRTWEEYLSPHGFFRHFHRFFER